MFLKPQHLLTLTGIDWKLRGWDLLNRDICTRRFERLKFCCWNPPQQLRHLQQLVILPNNFAHRSCPVNRWLSSSKVRYLCHLFLSSLLLPSLLLTLSLFILTWIIYSISFYNQPCPLFTNLWTHLVIYTYISHHGFLDMNLYDMDILLIWLSHRGFLTDLAAAFRSRSLDPSVRRNLRARHRWRGFGNNDEW